MVSEKSSQSTDPKNADFPEFPELKPDEIAGMSHDDKLKLIEREAQTLYDFCVEKGLSQKDLSWCLKPLFGSPPEFVKKAVKDNAKFFTTLAVVFSLVAIVVGWSPAYNFFCVHGKLALMKVLPYWDWTYIYDQDCLVKNPYLAPTPNITREECQSCFEISKNGLESLQNASHDVIANEFLLVDFPAIIEDGTKGWPKPNLDLASLSKEYNSHKDLDTVGDCRFNSSIEGITNVYDFFNAYKSKTLPDTYYAFWDNCDLKAAKHFRLNYKRPYYLPPMAEAAKMSTFFVAKGKSDDAVPFYMEDDSSGMWVTVISGKLLVDVVPVESCADFKGCNTASSEIKKGEAIIVPLRLWQLDVSSAFDGETIAIGSPVSWDESEGAPEDEDIGGDNSKNEKEIQGDPVDDGPDSQGPDDEGPSDAEPNDGGPSDEEQIDGEPSDEEQIDGGPSDGVPSDAEPRDTQPVDETGGENGPEKVNIK